MKPAILVNNLSDKQKPAEELKIRYVFSAIGRESKTLIRLGVFGAIVVVILVLGIYLARPTNIQASLGFRVSFSGVENGRYPNRVRFTPSDIVANSVLEEVYHKHSLMEAIPFGDFTRCFAVLESNPGLAKLQKDYEAILASRSLTPVERKRLEDEYSERVRALRNGEFELVAFWNPKKTNLQAKNLDKLMKDILETWASQATARGVFKFDINIVSTNILPTINDSPDYLVATDRFRLATERVLRNVRDLDKIPSARQVRVGNNRISLGELQSALEDILKYRFSLMEAAVMRFGLYKNKSMSESYLSEQLLRLDTAGNELQNRLRAIQETFLAYTSGRSGQAELGKAPSTPANERNQNNSSVVAESFLDQVMDLSNRSEDMAFRQNLLRLAVDIGDRLAGVDTEKSLYERRLKLLQNSAPEIQGAAEAKELVTNQLSAVSEELTETIQNMQLIHEEVSRISLRPETVYNVLAERKAGSSSVVNMRLVAVLLVGVWTIYFGVCLLLISWSAALSGRQQPALSSRL